MRINSSGTPLEGEELIYSLIKSSWIEAPTAIQKLTHKLATPARTALLASRLVRARSQGKSGESGARFPLPSTPSVNEFRRLMLPDNDSRDSGFFSELKRFVAGDGIAVFEKAHSFLTLGKFALPPVLATELAQRSPDVFFLFLRWLDRLAFFGIDPMSLPDRVRQRAIGFLTAVGWFCTADGKQKAVSAIWHELQISDADDIRDYFGRNQFRKTYQLDTRGRMHMIPLMSPDDLELALKTRILGQKGCVDTITREDSSIWKDWEWWEWLIDERRPKQVDSALNSRFRPTEANLQEGETVTDHVRDAWNRFMDSAWGNRSLLIYVQRDWLNLWFPDFDPSLPEFLEDKNRPWDFDHIHPQSYLQGERGGSLKGIPQLIKDWNNSIGNLRAWPLEANRADGDLPPVIKLDEVGDEERRYNIHSGKDERNASFVNEESWNEYWKNCVPAEGNLNSSSNHHARHALVSAIILRFIDIYREWYDSLKLSTIC